MTRPGELDEARQDCVKGEALLATGDGEAAARLFRAVLTRAGSSASAGGGTEEVPGGASGRSAGDDGDSAQVVARACVGLGRVLLAAGEPVRAAVEFRRAARLEPAGRDALYWLGCAAAHQGAYPTAEQRFSQVLDVCAGDGAALVQRGYVRVRLGRTADALADLRSAERAGALDAEARWVLAALSGATARDVARLLGTAARAALQGAQAAGAQGRAARSEATAPPRPPRAVGGWSRAVDLLDRARQLDPDEWEFVLPHAVALCLSGRRDDGLALLTGVSRSLPADRHLAHTLAVMAWHALPPPDTADTAGKGAFRAWTRCVALWAGLLHDTAFWERRRTEAAERYGTPIDDTALATLRADLQARLEALMPEGGSGGRPSPEAVLHRESEAARLLADAGGLPVVAGAAPLVCGPLRLVELGRERELGRFVAAAGEAAPALRHAFSHLGFAQALLRLDRPGEALTALSGLRCPSCRARGTGAEDDAPRAEQRGGPHTAGTAAHPADGTQKSVRAHWYTC